MDCFNKNLAANLCRIRKQNGLTQLDIALRAGISFRTYQRIEMGKISPRASTVFQILKALNVNFSEVLTQSAENQIKICDTNKEYCPLCSDFKMTPASSLQNLNPSIRETSFLTYLSTEAESIGYWEINLTTREYYLSKKMYEIYGMPISENFTFLDFYKRIHPEDIAKVNSDLDKLVQFNVIYNNTHRINIDGKEFLVSAAASKFVNKDQQTIIFGVAQRI